MLKHRTHTRMAILRLSKEINDIQTTTATAVVTRWWQLSSVWSSSSLSSSSSSVASSSGGGLLSENDENQNYYSYYQMYEIPDNQSQVKAVVSACYDTMYHHKDDDGLDDDVIVGSNTWDHDNNDHHHHPYVWYHPSQQQQCPCSYFNQNNNYTLLYRILYGCKQIIWKVGRSYYALPILVLLSTLSFGILIGYLIGTRRGSIGGGHSHRPNDDHNDDHIDRHRQPPQLQQQETTTKKSTTILYVGAIVSSYLIQLYMYIWNRIRLGYDLFRYTRQQKSQSSLEMRKNCNHEPWNDSSDQSKRFVIDRFSSTRTNDDCSNATIDQKEQMARVELKSDDETQRESGLSRQELPNHIAVVMDGNRRYGLQQYNDPIMGHWDGSKKLVQFVKWCVAEEIQELTVYAFSTENWSRSAQEVSALMNIIIKHCEELRIEAIAKQISIHIKSTDTDAIPMLVREVLYQLEKDTYHSHPTLRMNICLSYGSRGEIVQACRSIVTEFQNGNWTSLLQITEESITQKLLIGSSSSSSSSSVFPLSSSSLNHHTTSTTIHNDNNKKNVNNQSSSPDIFLRTSGEIRLSNFLLWQMAYTELFFLQKNWPELNKNDFLQVLRSYAHCRQRRFGR